MSAWRQGSFVGRVKVPAGFAAAEGFINRKLAQDVGRKAVRDGDCKRFKVVPGCHAGRSVWVLAVA